MALALFGTLDTIGLPDALRMLASTRKSGRLQVEGDRGRGHVWLREGMVTAAATEWGAADTPADQVLFELLRFDEGTFVFEADEQTDVRLGSIEHSEDVEMLLRRALALLEEWEDLQTVVPSFDHRVSLVAGLAGAEVTIDAQRWPSLVAVAGGPTVQELATALNLSELDVSRAVCGLVELGVAEVEAPEQDSHWADEEPSQDAGELRRRPVQDSPGFGVGQVPTTGPRYAVPDTETHAGWPR